MRSIDSLREYAANAPDASMSPIAKAIVAGLADSIEREVEGLREREYRNGREDAEGAVEFADRLKAAVDKREDVTLFGVDYTPLPLDADGVPIHVGDVMEWDNGTFTVHELKVTESGWTTWDEQHGYTVHADECRRHRAPTVEDVLREFFSRYVTTKPKDEDDAIIAEFAAKLRLAGDE